MTDGFHSEEWTIETVKEAKSGGAWFAKSQHDFADLKAAVEAGRDND